MITVWMGSANTWDCDEMGHMNVRVYVAKAMEGLARMAHAFEMPHAFRPHSPSTLLPADQHIRFLREARPGQPLEMTACVLDVGERDAVIYQELRHGDGGTAAAFRTLVRHVEVKSAQPFPWSARSRAALERLADSAPAHTAPRSIEWPGPRLPAEEATLEAAKAAGAPLIGLGATPPEHVGPHGRLRAEWFMGRLSDSVPNLLADWRAKVGGGVDGAEYGAAVLEYRLVYRRWPQAGDLFEVRSGLGAVGEKTHSLVHWILDPVSGAAWATAEAVAVTFDLVTRKVIPTQAEQIKELQALAPPGLAI